MTAIPQPIESLESSSSGSQVVREVSRCYRVQPENVPAILPSIERFMVLTNVCSGGVNDALSVFDLAEVDSAQIWVVEKPTGTIVGAFVSELRDYPLGRVLRVWAGGGDKAGLDAFEESMGVVEAFAREEGCVLMEAECPPAVVPIMDWFGPIARVVLLRKF